jgi:hypothetical protein
MTARAHVSLRIAAVVWIAALVVLPRWLGASAPSATETPASPAPTSTHAHSLAPMPHGPALAKR